MIRNVSLFSSTVLFSLFFASAPIVAQPTQAPLSLATAAEVFGARQTATHADMSPDGKRIIFLTAGPDSQSQARVIDVDTLHQKILLKSSGKPEALDRCEFGDDRFAICRFSGNIHYGNLIIGLSRSILLDTETGKFKSLTVPNAGDSSRINQFDGFVIDWLPDEHGAVLMQRNYADQDNGSGVDRVQFQPLKFKRVESPSSRVDRYFTDGHGIVRFTSEAISDFEDHQTGDMRYKYRRAGIRDWIPFPADDKFEPLMVERQSNSLYYLDALDGRQALYRVKLDGVSKPELIGKHDQVDIDGVIRLAPGEPVIGYRFTDDRSRSVYTDPFYAKLNAKLSRALPKSPLISFVGASKDRKRFLIFAAGDTDPGAFYVLFADKMELRSVLEAREQLDGIGLAPVKSITIPTRDGKTIPGYITAAATNPLVRRPTIIMPHGGPSARDDWGFDWLAQFLASQGYVVVQPNYRGSGGYGDEFLGENAFKGWKLAMSDIADAADWAVKSGVSDPDRMAALGWSYGGYAALQSAALDPRYKAVVAIAPVTDLGALRRDAEGFTDEEIAKDMIGKGPHLKEGSPYYNAAMIKVPVLLVHGEVDSNVRIAHSQRMERALRKAGTPVEFLQYKPLDHYLDDSEARVQMLTKIGELLDRTIGH